MSDKKRALADQVQAIAAKLDGKTFTVLVWDGDVWCATVSYGITKERLEQAGKFWTSEAEKMQP